jgi:hypothetical protein
MTRHDFIGLLKSAGESQASKAYPRILRSLPPEACNRWILGIQLPLGFTAGTYHLSTGYRLGSLPTDVSRFAYPPCYRARTFTKADALYQSHLHRVRGYLGDGIE